MLGMSLQDMLDRSYQLIQRKGCHRILVGPQSRPTHIPSKEVINVKNIFDYTLHRSRRSTSRYRIANNQRQGRSGRQIDLNLEFAIFGNERQIVHGELALLDPIQSFLFLLLSLLLFFERLHLSLGEFLFLFCFLLFDLRSLFLLGSRSGLGFALLGLATFLFFKVGMDLVGRLDLDKALRFDSIL